VTFLLSPEPDRPGHQLASWGAEAGIALAFGAAVYARVRWAEVTFSIALLLSFMGAVKLVIARLKKRPALALTVSTDLLRLSRVDTGALVADRERGSVKVHLARWSTPWWFRGRFESSSILDCPALIIEGLSPVVLSVSTVRSWSGASGARIRSPSYVIAPAEWESLVGALISARP
jgi:hypothetical protein